MDPSISPPILVVWPTATASLIAECSMTRDFGPRYAGPRRKLYGPTTAPSSSSTGPFVVSVTQYWPSPAAWLPLPLGEGWGEGDSCSTANTPSATSLYWPDSSRY